MAKSPVRDDGLVRARAGNGEVGRFDAEGVRIDGVNHALAERDHLDGVRIGSLDQLHSGGKAVRGLRLRVADFDGDACDILVGSDSRNRP